jgi:hypothetical protein
MMRLFVLLAAFAVLAVIVAGSALAGGGAAPKATGDIWFQNTGYGPGTDVAAHWVFNAQEGSPAKGNMSYTDQYGSYTANVTGVSVHGQDADITAQVTSSTYPYAQVGDTFSWTVHDRGEPGVGHDYFTYHWSGGNLDLPTITAGNLQVHA